MPSPLNLLHYLQKEERRIYRDLFEKKQLNEKKGINMLFGGWS